MELPINGEQQAALLAAQAAIAECVASMAGAIEAAEPGGTDAIFAALQAGTATVVAHLEVMPAGPVALELQHVDGRRWPLGLLVFRPDPVEH